jgi:hypothetical protein
MIEGTLDIYWENSADPGIYRMSFLPYSATISVVGPVIQHEVPANNPR